MRRIAAVLLLASALAGCDVALAAFFASKSSESKASTPAAPDLRFQVYVADLGETVPGDLDTAETDLNAATGTPPAAWVFVGAAESTTEFDVSGFLGGAADAVLVWSLELKDYEVDAIEGISAAGSTTHTAPNARIRSNRIDDKSRAAAFPDGLTAKRVLPVSGTSYLFSKFVAPLSRIRVNGWSPTRASGDVDFIATVARGGDQIAGGVGMNAAGVAYVSFIDSASRNVFLQRFDAAGATVGALLPIEVTTNALVGTPSVLVDIPRSFVYVGSTVNNGDIRIQKFDLSMNVVNPLFSGLATAGAEFLEWNGIALDSSGNMAIAAAITGSGFDHWVTKVSSSGLSLWGGTPAAPVDVGDSWWYGVACDSGGDVILAGDITEGGGPVNREAIVRRVSSLGVNDWSYTPANVGQVDRAHSVAVDSSGNIWVGGFSSSGGQRDGTILKLDAAGTPAGGVFPLVHAGAASQNDEILDLAIDVDGFIFAVGYETQDAAAQGQDWWIRKISPSGATVWTRTYHHGTTAGNDRAVSVAVQGDAVVVSGEVVIAGGSTEIHVRRDRR